MQEKLEMWLDKFPEGEAPPPSPVDVNASQPRGYELRVII
jgi:hypothetical protein